MISTPRTARDSSSADAPMNSVSDTTAITESAESTARSRPQSRRALRLDAGARAARIKGICRIEDVVMQHGVPLRTVGDGHRLVGRCPFHTEQQGSFTVYPATQSFYCFGCHTAGDVINFICLLHQVTFNEALRILGEQRFEAVGPTNLRSHTNHRSKDTPRPVRADSAPELDTVQETQETTEHNNLDDGEETAISQTMLWIASLLGAQGLVSTPEVLNYLGTRGISYALARRCHLGYLADDLLASLLVGHPALERIARQIGLLSRARHTTLLRRLLIPEIRNGQTAQLIGRVIPGIRTPMERIKYYLVCGAGEKHLLGYGAALQRLGQTQRPASLAHRQVERGRQELRGILVLEGALDYVLAVGWELPVLPTALLSCYPSRGQLAELLDLQRRTGGLPLLLQLDGDDPGQEASAHLARTLDEQQVSYQVLSPLPRLPASSSTYKDLGELGPLGSAGRDVLRDSLERALNAASAVSHDAIVEMSNGSQGSAGGQ